MIFKGLKQKVQLIKTNQFSDFEHYENNFYKFLQIRIFITQWVKEVKTAEQITLEKIASSCAINEIYQVENLNS